MDKEELEAIVLATLFHLELKREEIDTEIAIQDKPSMPQRCFKSYLTGKIHAYRELRDYIMGKCE